MRKSWVLEGVFVSLLLNSALYGQSMPHARLRAVPLEQVKIDDTFWGPKLDINRMVTLPHSLKEVQTTSTDNFAKAAGRMEGKFNGLPWNDSDIYKVIEGAAYILAVHPDKQMEARLDEIIEIIAAAQQPDGYLDTFYQLTKKPEERWTRLIYDHEMYCAGHLFEAAVAYHQATGKDKLLHVARKLADHIDGIFGPGKRVDFPGHEEIELGLIKLYRQTGEPRYRKLAEFFIAVRGGATDERAAYRQAHLPVKEQSEIVGHAVRAMYLYCGVADVAALTGDPGYMTAMERIWQDVVYRKLYITGGIGATHSGEAFGARHELPNTSAYAETCAAIGLALWNHRLMLLHGEGRFVDVYEQALYNGILSGVSLSGDQFFYVNPLASSGGHHRQSWFGCACCPPNVLRMLAQIGQTIYAHDDHGIWVNLYIGSDSGSVTLTPTKARLRQETQYPWSGQVKITVKAEPPAEFDLNLRIPGWCQGSVAIKVNGQTIETPAVAKGYVQLRRAWRSGDVVELDLPMEIQRVAAHPAVEADRGLIALQRGPIVYCVEAVDHDGMVTNLSLPPDAGLKAVFAPSLLGGVTVLKGKALADDMKAWQDKLYQPVNRVRRGEVEFTAIPYYAWDNRAAGEMVVWIPQTLPSQ